MRDLMRVSAASAGNDHRLGGNEAPPAIVSIFLGDELTEVLKSIENDTYFGKHSGVQLETGAHVLPTLLKTPQTETVLHPLHLQETNLNFVCSVLRHLWQVPMLYSIQL